MVFMPIFITKTRLGSILRFFKAVKKYNFQMKTGYIFFLFLLKTLIVGTR